MKIYKALEGFVWESAWMKVSRLKAFWFAIATGDWNRIHFNPFTWFLYKSNLGGQTVTGDMLLSLTKRGALEMVKNDETEIVAYGYDEVDFKRPLHIGVVFKYTYTLAKKENIRGVIVYHWLIEVVNTKGRKLSSAIWKAGYLPVDKSSIGKKVLPVVNKLPGLVGVACLVFLGLGVWKMSKNPKHVIDEFETFSHPAAVAF